MAKKGKSLGFNKATITKDDEGVFWITETMKDYINVYNLTQKLDEWLDIEGITLGLKKDDELPSEE